MKNKLIKRIEALGAEAQQLMQIKAQYEQGLRDVDARMHQISGAITELGTMVKECEDEVLASEKVPLTD